MSKITTFEVNGQKLYLDWDLYEAEQKFMRAKERELIPEFLWETFGLLEPKENEQLRKTETD